MNLPRLVAMSTLILFILAGSAGEVLAASAICEGATPFPNGISVVKALRVFVGPDGESDVQSIDLTAQSKAYFKPGELFSHIDLGGAQKVQLVSGPPNAVMPMHASPGKEMFLTVQGSSAVVLKDGREFPLTPGALVIMDDKGSKTGHGGRTGPCGYVALNVVPAQ